MRQSSTTFLLLLLCSSTLTAQTASPAAPPAVVAPTAAQSSAQTEAMARLRLEMAPVRLEYSCPVKLTVDRRPQGAFAQVDRSSLAKHVQKLNISFGESASPMAAADIVVQGYPVGGQMIPADGFPVPKEVTETFHLTARDGHPLTGSNIWTEHIAVVNRIELTHIQYADGTTWQSSSSSRCSAVPSLFLLVNSAATR